MVKLSLLKGFRDLKTAPEIKGHSIIKEVQSDGPGRKNPALS
jgi:hypothetical protein